MRGRFLPFILLIMVCSVSGCVLLAIPGGALLGHTIQKSNQEYDDIIVNMGYKYKVYNQESIRQNQENAKMGRPIKEIQTFCIWLETQPQNEKERKAVERYKRLNGSSGS